MATATSAASASLLLGQLQRDVQLLDRDIANLFRTLCEVNAAAPLCADARQLAKLLNRLERKRRRKTRLIEILDPSDP